MARDYQNCAPLTGESGFVEEADDVVTIQPARRRNYLLVQNLYGSQAKMEVFFGAIEGDDAGIELQPGEMIIFDGNLIPNNVIIIKTTDDFTYWTTLTG